MGRIIRRVGLNVVGYFKQCSNQGNAEAEVQTT